MSEMVDRVALRIGEQLIAITEEDIGPTYFRGEDMRRLARAAIIEAREATGNMLENQGVIDAYEGKLEQPSSDTQHCKWIWQAMIDAALSD